MYIKKRRRGTAVVGTTKGIIVTAGSRGVFILPGGEAGRNETRTAAAIRELREETGLVAHSVKFLFRHKGVIRKSLSGSGWQDYHTVVLVKAYGTPKPRHEVMYIDFYRKG